ncbi:MAG: CusA/CzcA family heavy metal efflux RND transporter [Bacteroidota bacterium]|nr:CusA/CzcA family heavy metal efflux RND transporter [Bacteroidota bacterium]
MIDKIISFSIRHGIIVILSTIFVFGLGLWVYTLLKIEAYPDISDTNVIVITKYEGRAAEEVEQQVTIPIERALNNVPGVLDRRSRTIFGLSVVQLTFQENVTDFYARQYVAEKLQYAELPDGVTPELGPLTSPTGEVYRYVLQGNENFTPMDIRTFNDWTIRPKLLQVPGIADISTFGGPIKQFQVLTSPERMRKYNMTVKQLIDAIEENNLNTGGNIIERGGQGFAVRGIGAIKSLRDLENIVIASTNGVPIFLRDVASVEIAPPSPSGIMGYTIPDSNINVDAGTEGIILLKRGENANEVLNALNEKIEEVKSELPEGIKLHILYDRSNLIKYTLSTVSRTLVEGITIVVIILILFLGSFRSAIVVAITIPISLLFAFILMKITGIPANLLSLGAIDFGIIVDGACIMVEHLIRTIKTAKPEQRKLGIFNFAEHSAQEIGKEIFFSVTIIILAYLPLFTLQRVEGKLFSPMAFTLSYAILGSMLCALTIIPVLISFVYKKRFENLEYDFNKNRNILFGFFGKLFKKKEVELLKKPSYNIYEWFLDKFLSIPYSGIALTFVIVFLCGFLGMRMGSEFLPPLDEGSIFLRCNLPSGISIKESAKISPPIRKIICNHPQVKNVFTQTGRNDDGTDPFGANRTEILVDLKDYSTWVNDTSKHDLTNKIKLELEKEFQGAYFSYGQPIIDQVTEIVNGSAADLAITVGYDSLPRTREIANQIAKTISQLRGASEVGIEQEGPQAQIVVEIKRENAARYGINISDIQLMIEAAIGGKTISTVYEGTKRFDLVIRFLPENRNTIDAIRKMLVPSLNGSRVPMSELAEIKMIDGQTNIYRIESKRIITVRSNIRGRDQAGFAAEASEKIKEMNIPHDVKIGLGGQFENLTRASKQLAIVIPLTLLIISIVLYFMYRNISDTLMTILCLPFGIFGGVSALLIRGYYFNVSAGVGFVSLFGVSVMAGVLLISAYSKALIHETVSVNETKDFESMKKHLKNVIIVTSNEQIRPILMMITVAMIGLLPAATSKGIGSDIQRPLSTVIIGGLISCLVLVPVLLPNVYYRFAVKKLKKEFSN